MNLTEQLYQPFEDISSRKGRGGTYSYIKWQEVADRMNKVFGVRWSSSVVYQDIIGNNIIVRVSVCAKDSETGETFCQEGFGGAVNDDKAEAGNPFKSAYSKAFKDACKRWGVGLNLVEDDAEPVASTVGMPTGYMGREFGIPETKIMAPPIESAMSTPPLRATVVPMPPPVSTAPTVPPPLPAQSQYVSVGPAMEAPSAAPALEAVLPVAKKLPSMPLPTGMSMPNVSMNGSMTSGGVPSFAQPKVHQVNTPEEGSISDVQKVALNNILKQFKEHFGTTYEELAAEAFQDAGIEKPVPSPEKLSYSEAMHVVKYSNAKIRKNQ